MQLMATGGSTPYSGAGPSRTRDEASPFSDDTVRFFQLVCIYVKLVPRILHDLFKHHYKDSQQVEWDDSEKQRKDLAAKMKRKKVQPWFSSKEVEEKSIALWDVTNSCAALNAMADLPQYITNVRKARNNLLHQTETEVPLEGFNKMKGFVQQLISEPDLSLPKDVYQNELDTLASFETFRKRFNRVQDVAELHEMLKHMMEDARRQGELGEKLSEMLEALMSKLNDRLQCLQEVMQREHEDIKEVVRKGFDVTLQEVEKVQNQLKDLPSQLCQPKADEADEATQKLISLFEAGNASHAREELPRIFPHKLEVDLRTSDKTAAYAFALQHHPSLKKLVLYFGLTTGSVNLQLLLDALSHHPTVRYLYVDYPLPVRVGNIVHADAAEDRAALCKFLRGKHRLAKVELNEVPVEVAVAALSTESSTMEEFKWICDIHVDDATGNLLDLLRNTSLKCINIGGSAGKVLLPILRGLAENSKTIYRTVVCENDFPLDLPLVSQLAELGQFLVPCVSCDLSMPLPVGVWGSLLSGVGNARQLERLKVDMFGMRGKPEGAGPEWDHIDQPTLKKEERSWAHSSFWEVVFNISGCLCFDEESGDWYMFQDIQGSTLDATMKLLCAVVRGIIQRKDQFVLKLQVNDEQVSRLVELEDIAKNKCAVTRTEREVEAKNRMTNLVEGYTHTVLELEPLSSDQKNTSSQPPASQSRK